MNNGKALLKPNPILWLLAAAVIVRLTSLYLTPMINSDSCRYINSAHQFLSGNFSLGLSYAGSLPIYPWMLVAAHLLIPDWVLAGQLISALCLILAVIPLYRLTRDLFDENAAFWSSLAFVLSPELNLYAGEIIRESPFALVFLWTAYFARKVFAEAKPLDCLWVSLLALLAFSLRFEMVVFIVGFPLMLAFFAVRDQTRRVAWLKGLGVFVAVPAGLLLVLLPMLFTHAADIRLGGGVNFFLERLFQFDFLGSYPAVYAQLQNIEASFPGAQFSNDVIETTRHFLPFVYLFGLIDAIVTSLSLLFAVLAVWGLVRRPQKWNAAAKPLLFLTGAFLLAAYFVLINRNFISDRYLLAPMLLLLPWVGWGMRSLIVWCGTFKAARSWSFGLIALFVVIPAADTAVTWERGPGVQEIAGHWLRDHHEKSNIRLLVNDERIPFYAGFWMGEYLPYYPNSYDDLEMLALEANRNLIAIKTSKKKPQAIPKMDRFKLLKEFENDEYVVSYYEAVN